MQNQKLIFPGESSPDTNRMAAYFNYDNILYLTCNKPWNKREIVHISLI